MSNWFFQLICIGCSFKRQKKNYEIWVDQGGEFCNNLFKRFLKINNTDMYSRSNEGKSGVVKKIQ